MQDAPLVGRLDLQRKLMPGQKIPLEPWLKTFDSSPAQEMFLVRHDLFKIPQMLPLVSAAVGNLSDISKGGFLSLRESSAKSELAQLRVTSGSNVSTELLSLRLLPLCIPVYAQAL